MLKNQKLVEQMKEKWKSGIVPQKMVSEFTGGLLKSQSLVNLCSKGEGPKNKIYIRGCACWEIDNFIDWLLESMSVEYDGFEIRKKSPHHKTKTAN